MQVIKNFELSVREETVDLPEHYGTRLLTSADCGVLARKIIGSRAQEYFIAFLLNLNQQVLGYQVVAMGRQDMCPIDMRVLFRAAVSLGAAFIVVSHNHPEGNPQPSNMDIRVTDLVTLSGDILGIPLLDHVVVSPKGMFSFKASGMMLPKMI